MGWAGSLIGGAAGIISQPAQLEAINAQNEATKEGYIATDEAITFTQSINRSNAEQGAAEISQEVGTQVGDKKVEQAKARSATTISRGEGVTAGTSLARQLQTQALDQGKELSRTEQAGQSAINKMYTQMENDNFALQQEKVGAWNTANGNIITRDEAGTQMIGSVLGGFQ